VNAPRRHRLPGDRPPRETIARMLRVDHAGEFGAVRIYQGQLAVLGRNGRMAAEIRRMAAAEACHLARFENLLRERRVRPTLLDPLWSILGYALGAATAVAGAPAAMACTAAIEEVIDEHYRTQADDLADEDPELRREILAFRDDEIAHRDAALAGGAEEAPLFDVLTGAIRAAARLAIRLSTRL
jgi:ubiquinone biosynthesis monooxygenase Coq7